MKMKRSEFKKTLEKLKSEDINNKYRLDFIARALGIEIEEETPELNTVADYQRYYNENLNNSLGNYYLNTLKNFKDYKLKISAITKILEMVAEVENSLNEYKGSNHFFLDEDFEIIHTPRDVKGVVLFNTHESTEKALELIQPYIDIMERCDYCNSDKDNYMLGYGNS